MKTITKKIQPPYFKQILTGKKRFDIRLNHLDKEDVKGIFCPKCKGRGWIQEESDICHDCVEGFKPGMNKEDFCYQVGDTLRLREWIEKQKTSFSYQGEYGSIGRPMMIPASEISYYTGRQVVCQITSIVHLYIRDYPLNDNVGLNSAGPPTVMIDGKEFWKGEEIGQYGLVVLGIEVRE
jgi:hypothetical protein